MTIKRDLCEHDWPGSGCKQCYPPKPVEHVTSLSVEHEGKVASITSTATARRPTMADEIPAELHKPKRLALTQDELSIIFRRRERQKQVEAERERTSSLVSAWVMNLGLGVDPESQQALVKILHPFED